MAQSGSDAGAEEVKESTRTQCEDEVAITLSRFLASPTWLYPIIRFLGHALRTYRYDLEFIRSTPQEDKRNWILYENYCDLVGCLLAKFSKVYDVKPSKIIFEVLSADAEPAPGVPVKNVRSMNFIKATYRAIHFGYMMMSYCNLYKVKCCEDMKEEMKQMKVADSQKENWDGLWQHLNEEIAAIIKGQVRVENLLTKYATVMVDEMRYGPFICAYGIKMHDGDYKYNPALDRLLDSMLNLERRRESLNKEKMPKQKQKSTAEKKIPDELAMLLETTKLMEESSSSPSSEDDCGLQEMKAEAIEKLNSTLIESPASSTFITVSDRLALVMHIDTLEPQYYTAPSTPDILEQEIEESPAGSKSKQKNSKSPEPAYATAHSSPEKAKFLDTQEEFATIAIQKRTGKSPKPTGSSFPELTQTAKESVAKPLKKRSSKSPEFAVSPLMDEQVARESVMKLIKSQKESSSKSPDLAASPSPDREASTQTDEELVTMRAKSQKKRTSKSPKPTRSPFPEHTPTAEESVTKPVKKSYSKSPDLAASPSPDREEFTQTGEESVTMQAKSLKKRSCRSPEITASSSPDREELTQMTEESVTKPAKLRKKRMTKSPRPRYVTAPSSPIPVKPKLLSESPQELKKLSSKLKVQKASSAGKQPSPEITVTLPGNDRERNKFILNGYDERMEKQLAFMATTFVLQNAIGVKKGLKDLVGEQRWFERTWPSPQSEADKTKKKIELTPGTAMERREMKMLDDVFNGKALLEILWDILDARMAKK